MYRSVYNLTAEELDELRSALFWHDPDGGDWYDDLSEESKAIVDNAAWPDEIPDRILFETFDGIDFVEEDFFCNINDGNYEGCGAVYA